MGNIFTVFRGLNVPVRMLKFQRGKIC
jgi:hypothetical protein